MVFDNVMDSGMDKPIRYTQFELWNLFVEWGQRRTIFDKIIFDNIWTRFWDSCRKWPIFVRKFIDLDKKRNQLFCNITIFIDNDRW